MRYFEVIHKTLFAEYSLTHINALTVNLLSACEERRFFNRLVGSLPSVYGTDLRRFTLVLRFQSYGRACELKQYLLLHHASCSLS